MFTIRDNKLNACFLFLVMYSFEGDFRRKPQQNLAGASSQRKTDRDALILQTQQQRQKREVEEFNTQTFD